MLVFFGVFVNVDKLNFFVFIFGLLSMIGLLFFFLMIEKVDFENIVLFGFFNIGRFLIFDLDLFVFDIWIDFFLSERFDVDS